MAKEQLTKAQKAKRRRHLGRQIKGAVFIMFAVIGVLSVLSGAARLVLSTFSKEEDKDVYASLIAPLVALDPVPFESIDKAEINMLTESAIWATIRNEDVSKYERTDEGQLLIPRTDISIYFAKMYGTHVDMGPRRTFVSADLTYEFSVEKDSYILPVTGQVGSYVPKVTDIKTTGGTKVLTVAYILADENGVDVTKDISELNVVKYMEYILVKGDNGWNIYAVRYMTED